MGPGDQTLTILGRRIPVPSLSHGVPKLIQCPSTLRYVPLCWRHQQSAPRRASRQGAHSLTCPKSAAGPQNERSEPHSRVVAQLSLSPATGGGGEGAKKSLRGGKSTFWLSPTLCLGGRPHRTTGLWNHEGLPGPTGLLWLGQSGPELGNSCVETRKWNLRD